MKKALHLFVLMASAMALAGARAPVGERQLAPSLAIAGVVVTVGEPASSALAALRSAAVLEEGERPGEWWVETERHQEISRAAGVVVITAGAVKLATRYWPQPRSASVLAAMAYAASYDVSGGGTSGCELSTQSLPSGNGLTVRCGRRSFEVSDIGPGDAGEVSETVE